VIHNRSSVPTLGRRGAITYLLQNPFSHTLRSRKFSSTQLDAIGDAVKQVGGSLPEKLAAGDMWRLDG